VDKNIFCPTTAAARGRAMLEEQGIEIPDMQCDNANAARRGIVRLLKLAKALRLNESQALEYGFCTPTNNSEVQTALIKAWRKPKVKTRHTK